MPGPADRQAQDQGEEHGGGKSGEQGEQAAQGRPPGPLVQAEGYAHDRAVFRADDYGPDDQDL